MRKLDRSDSVDFLDLGDNEFILRCEVSRDLQCKYDDAKSRYQKDRDATALRQLESVQNQIRASKPDEILKSDALPELRKIVGKTTLICEYNGKDLDPAGDALRRAAAESAMRALHPRSLGKSLADRIARIFGVPIDVARLPERIRVAYARAIALDELGATEEQRRVADEAMREVVAMIATSRELNDLDLSGGRSGARHADYHADLGGGAAQAEIRRPAGFPQDTY
jgi:hypothetical protein